MTTLDSYFVKKIGGYTITKKIAGDLSFAYEVRPNHQIAYRPGSKKLDYISGFGISAKNLKDAEKVVRLAKRHGYRKAQEIWWSKTGAGSGYYLGFLKGKEAEKYAFYDGAYGDYVKEIRRKSKKRKITTRDNPMTFIG
jgi:hypothetical protein